MTTIEKYQSDYENYMPDNKVYFRRIIRYRVSYDKFVVPWQLDYEKKEKPKKD